MVWMTCSPIFSGFPCFWHFWVLPYVVNHINHKQKLDQNDAYGYIPPSDKDHTHMCATQPACQVNCDKKMPKVYSPVLSFYFGYFFRPYYLYVKYKNKYIRMYKFTNVSTNINTCSKTTTTRYCSIKHV